MVASALPTEVSPTQACQVAPPSTEVSSCAERAAAGFVHWLRSNASVHTVTSSGTAIGPKFRVPSARLILLSIVTEIRAAPLGEAQSSSARDTLINRIRNAA